MIFEFENLEKKIFQWKMVNENGQDNLVHVNKRKSNHYQPTQIKTVLRGKSGGA